MCQFISVPKDRDTKIKNQFVPHTEKEFYESIENATKETLQSYGFGVWDSLSEVVKENLEGSGEPKYVNFPTFDESWNPVGETTLKVGADNRPLDFEKDKWIMLFPREWFDIIPDGFTVVGLYGEQYIFDKINADNDARFGCLGYGIFIDKN